MLRSMEYVACYYITGSYRTQDYGLCMRSKHYADLAYAVSFLPYYWRAMQVFLTLLFVFICMMLHFRSGNVTDALLWICSVLEDGSTKVRQATWSTWGSMSLPCLPLVPKWRTRRRRRWGGFHLLWLCRAVLLCTNCTGTLLRIGDCSNLIPTTHGLGMNWSFAGSLCTTYRWYVSSIDILLTTCRASDISFPQFSLFSSSKWTWMLCFAGFEPCASPCLVTDGSSLQFWEFGLQSDFVLLGSPRGDSTRALELLQVNDSHSTGTALFVRKNTDNYTT